VDPSVVRGHETVETCKRKDILLLNVGEEFFAVRTDTPMRSILQADSESALERPARIVVFHPIFFPSRSMIPF
jgi:hypothetical protein